VSDIFTDIKAVGIAAIASKYGCEVSKLGFTPCPVCGASTRHTKRKDGRPSCIIVQSDNGWMCLQCDAKGDTVDLLARFINGGKRPTSPGEWRGVLQGFSNGSATLPPPRAISSPLGASPLASRPPFGEVMQVWGRSMVVPRDRNLPWLKSKFPAYELAELVDLGIARWLPKSDNPDWWPWRHEYLACLAFDARGLVQSIHGRIAGDVEPGKPKSRFPKGYSASGLVLANKSAVSWLRGKMDISTVVIAEGLTSTLACSMALRKLGYWKWGVLGYISGSHSAIKDMPWDDEEVFIFTDNDKTGDAYAERISQSLPSSIHARRMKL
jgi:hypothetical protein